MDINWRAHLIVKCRSYKCEDRLEVLNSCYHHIFKLIFRILDFTWSFIITRWNHRINVLWIHVRSCHWCKLLIWRYRTNRKLTVGLGKSWWRIILARILHSQRLHTRLYNCLRWHASRRHDFVIIEIWFIQGQL